MLSIRNPRVRSLAEEVMRGTGAPNITAAITLALEHEVERVRETVSLHERIEMLRKWASERAVRPGVDVSKADIDDLWEP